LLLVLLEWVILKLKFVLLSNKGDRAWKTLGTILAILIIGVRRSILPWSSWYVSNVSIIFDAPCFFLHHLLSVSLHFVAFLCIFRN
jgi:hypothetical protein